VWGVIRKLHSYLCHCKARSNCIRLFTSRHCVA